MRRAVILFCALCVVLAGCGGSSADVSLYDLQKEMLAADDSLPEMLTVNSSAQDAEESFSYLSSLSYDKVDGYFLAYSASGLADEIAVIAVKDPADAGEAADTLKEHARERANLYSFYKPDQAQRAENAVVFSSGPRAVLIISDQAAAVRSAYDRVVSGAV